MNSTPPPIPKKRSDLNTPAKILIALALLPGLLLGGLAICRACGLLRPFLVPTGAMAPAIASGDRVVMEGFSVLNRKPRRGDIVAFKADVIPSAQPGTIWVKRIAGLPGERLRISDGKLYINDTRVIITNAVGEINYPLPPFASSTALKMDVTVSAGHYYVLGDNSTNSLDSRYWGFLPRETILGRIFFCYWPPKRIGMVE